MPTHPVLIAGQWRDANTSGTFRAENPATKEAFGDKFPVSTWADCNAALTAAAEAAAILRDLPRESIGSFLSGYADRIEGRKEELVEIAHQETGLPKSPRLGDMELPRTAGQLRQAAAAAVQGSWAMPTIDSKNNIRSYLAAIGPVCVFGPNNFPFAFNGISGGDFAAAIAAGNPVITKGHPSHPGTTKLLAAEALAALKQAGLPPATVQLIYHIGNSDGLRLVADPRVGATAFTGSRRGGLALKAAADAAGRPIYLEMSSINPVVILPGALAERSEKIAEEFAGSVLFSSGQLCTNPGFNLMIASEATEQFISSIKTVFEKAPPQTLLSSGVLQSLNQSVAALHGAGAELLTGGQAVGGSAYQFNNTILRISGAQFLANTEKLQTEAFGNATLIVVAKNIEEAAKILDLLEGNLTGCIYSATTGADDTAYNALAPHLRNKVGRLINDKMPTGVAVSAAMNHGGPYPATGHPGFTAVGIPASLRRFGALQSFDNVRPNRLPAPLQDKNPTGKMWRLIDGNWTTADVPTSAST